MEVDKLETFSIRISILQKRIKLLDQLGGSAHMDRHGNELFDTFEVLETTAIREALTKLYREEIEHLKRAERVTVQ